MAVGPDVAGGENRENPDIGANIEENVRGTQGVAQPRDRLGLLVQEQAPALVGLE